MGKRLYDIATELAKHESDTTDECWEWPGHRSPKGYGVIRANGRPTRVPRLSFEMTTGVNLGELIVRHRCDNPPCFRPSHLEPGTHADNTQDRIERGRTVNVIATAYAARSACVRGHEFTPENTGPVKGHPNTRRCRACARLAVQRHMLAKKLGLPNPRRANGS